MPDPLPFEYPSRASQFVGVPDQMQAQLIDERDRALEDYLQQFRAVQERIEAATDTTAWTAFTFSGTWTNIGSVWQTGQYRKVGDRVELRGLIDPGATRTAGTASAIATLPTGFRPQAQVILGTMGDQAGWNEPHMVRIGTDGIMYWDQGLDMLGLLSGSWITLDGLSFSVTA